MYVRNWYARAYAIRVQYPRTHVLISWDGHVTYVEWRRFANMKFLRFCLLLMLLYTHKHTRTHACKCVQMMAWARTCAASGSSVSFSSTMTPFLSSAIMRLSLCTSALSCCKKCMCVCMCMFVFIYECPSTCTYMCVTGFSFLWCAHVHTLYSCIVYARTYVSYDAIGIHICIYV